MTSLTSDLRALLERSIIKAREAAEKAADAALVTLAVYENEAFSSLKPEQKRLRNALRARARQLGNGNMKDGFRLLKEEVAYEQWHRRFFARFLAENELLMHPEGVPVTLEDCDELARDEGNTDGWELAAHYASLMLPGIFRVDDPSAQVSLAPEGRHALESIAAGLPLALFQADDTLGWAYQFWQTQQKKAVNNSGRKIGGSDISPVTQLFTEDYMVQFLLHNSLGAWWAVQYPDSPLIKSFTYLRFQDDGTPAAGTFPGWPKRVAEVTVMDPCCGSGHFLVAAFEMLYRMRMEEEGLGEAQAADSVLRDNLFGLELDARCTQIAAFALALSAWKKGGYRELPLLNIACSGIPVVGQWEVWEQLAGDDENLRDALKRQYNLFRNAPDLGSLIDPNNDPLNVGWFATDYTQIVELLHKAFLQEKVKGDVVTQIFGAAAEGVAKAAKLLAGKYTLVATNVPYLMINKQSEALKQFCHLHHSDAKADLATAFLERCRAFTKSRGSYALVTPQNWLFLGLYKNIRAKILRGQTLNHISRLGAGAFETISGEVVQVGLFILTNQIPSADAIITGLDVSSIKPAFEKGKSLVNLSLTQIKQKTQLANPDLRISLEDTTHSHLLSSYADAYSGIRSGDYPRFGRCFWEIPEVRSGWSLQFSTVNVTRDFGGCEHILLWEDGRGQLASYQEELAKLRYASGGWKQGRHAWGKKGVAVTQMGDLPCSLYTGELFDNNCSIIVPKKPEYLPAIWAFCKSPQYNEAVRRIDRKMNVTNATLVKVPFDLAYWQKVAEEAGPLPEPYSNDPTQWLFKGNPVGSTAPLQIAVARLLGYHWPQQEDDYLDALTSDSGIVCLPSISGAETGVERLRALLAAAYGKDWSPEVQERLLADVEYGGKNLEIWLRDGFFTQHCRLFHNRPFIWQVWDGLKDGFSALVNYHRLDTAGLDRLTYTYLGQWIKTQEAAVAAGVAGAEARLIAATELQEKLKTIRIGEPPYDIYIRWKALREQPQGWNPDLNDGVRLNIRPFVAAGVLRSRVSVNWNKDRGTNPDGSERLNDLHYSLAEKQAAQVLVEAQQQKVLSELNVKGKRNE